MLQLTRNGDSLFCKLSLKEITHEVHTSKRPNVQKRPDDANCDKNLK